jgi:hypothetical protein
MGLCIEFDGQRMGTGYAWSSATVSVTYGLDTEVWTPSAAVAEPHTAWSELAAWIADAARPWSPVTATVTWARGTLDDGSGAVEFGIVYSVDPDTFTPSAAFEQLSAANDNLYPVSTWPPTGYNVREWKRRGYMGDAANTGAARAGVTGLGDLAWTAEAVMSWSEVQTLTDLLAACTSPRRGWILQQTTGGTPSQYGTWRQVAIGAIQSSRLGPTLFRVTIELGGDAL